MKIVNLASAILVGLGSAAGAKPVHINCPALNPNTQQWNTWQFVLNEDAGTVDWQVDGVHGNTGRAPAQFHADRVVWQAFSMITFEINRVNLSMTRTMMGRASSPDPCRLVAAPERAF